MPDTAPAPPTPDPPAVARAAGLRYVCDETPGITRERCGETFRYRDPAGRVITERETIDRINALAIPPAYTDVWICPDPQGHIQATGRDDRGRKQYRYHPLWRQVRDETKYERMLAFGRALPALRDRVERDLRRPGLPREKVLATIVRLLETTLIRIGNEEYAKENRSFGLTTLRDRHVEITGGTLFFSFRAKSGKKQKLRLTDRRLARIVRRCQDLPGQHLFQYVDEEAVQHTVDSADVNAYLREISGQDFTAKDFRTWNGTILAALALQDFEAVDSQAAAKRNITRAIETVAARLGNTPAVCRKCYVHPQVLEAYLGGTLAETLNERVEEMQQDAGLGAEEQTVLRFLERRLAQVAQAAAGPPDRTGTAA